MHEVEGFLHPGNLYLDYLGGCLPPRGSEAVCGNSGLQGTIDGHAGLGCGCSKGCNFGLIIFLPVPALHCPFCGSAGGIIF